MGVAAPSSISGSFCSASVTRAFRWSRPSRRWKRLLPRACRMNEGVSWISCPACSTTGGMSVKPSATTNPSTESEMMAMASERLTPRRWRTTTAWSSATAIITAVPISVRETIARAAPSTIAAISSTPKQTVKTVLSVTCEGRNSGLGSVKGRLDSPSRR